MRFFWVVLAGLFLAGCETTPEPVREAPRFDDFKSARVAPIQDEGGISGVDRGGLVEMHMALNACLEERFGWSERVEDFMTGPRYKTVLYVIPRVKGDGEGLKMKIDFKSGADGSLVVSEEFSGDPSMLSVMACEYIEIAK